MGKQNEYRFNLKFDETDEDHRRVSEFLNSCGRKKASNMNEKGEGWRVGKERER